MSAAQIDRLYRAYEITEIWNISETTLKNAITSGELPGFYDNGKFATKAQYINEWLDARIQTAKTPSGKLVTKKFKRNTSDPYAHINISNKN